MGVEVVEFALGRSGVAAVGDGGADESEVVGGVSDSKIERLGRLGRVRKNTPKNVVMQP